MNKKRVTILVIIAVIVIAVASFIVLNQNHQNIQTRNFTIGSLAPNYGFLLYNGSSVNLSAWRGHLTVLWFVATWCSTCAQGDEALNQNYQFFKQRGIKIVELELYKDLGYQGPSIESMVNSYAPDAFSNGTIIPALAGYNITAAYDPKGYLDIYYLLSSDGKVLYINGSLAFTLGQLEQAINASV